MAADLGTSKTGARKAYRRGYGEPGHVDHYTHLTGTQRAELRALWDVIPPAGSGRAVGTSQEGHRARDLLAHYRAAGVTLAELGGVIGVSPQPGA